MKTQRVHPSERGFTLIELLVAMAITTIIVTVLVSITAIAIDTWNRSRSELRAARQAKAMVDSMARDFEALVVRRGNENEWLSAISSPPDLSSNAAILVFFTAATDRYDGEIGTATDLGGDVSCVGYKLERKDPIPGGTAGDFKTFVLNRLLVDPKDAFDTLLGKPEIGTLFTTTYAANLESEENFVCENVFQFTVTFHVEVTPPSTGTGTSPQPTNELVTISTSGGSTKFSIKGTGIVTVPLIEELKSGRITSVGISLTVLSDSGIDLLRKTPGKANDAAWLAKNSFEYSKLIQLPGM